jgi:hypothetical protein
MSFLTSMRIVHDCRINKLSTDMVQDNSYETLTQGLWNLHSGHSTVMNVSRYGNTYTMESQSESSGWVMSRSPLRKGTLGDPYSQSRNWRDITEIRGNWTCRSFVNYCSGWMTSVVSPVFPILFLFCPFPSSVVRCLYLKINNIKRRRKRHRSPRNVIYHNRYRESYGEYINIEVKPCRGLIRESVIGFR